MPPGRTKGHSNSERVSRSMSDPVHTTGPVAGNCPMRSDPMPSKSGLIGRFWSILRDLSCPESHFWPFFEFFRRLFFSPILRSRAPCDRFLRARRGSQDCHFHNLLPLAPESLDRQGRGELKSRKSPLTSRWLGSIPAVPTNRNTVHRMRGGPILIGGVPREGAAPIDRAENVVDQPDDGGWEERRRILSSQTVAERIDATESERDPVSEDGRRMFPGHR